MTNTVTTSSEHDSGVPAKSEVRPEIQALRAIAVGGVVVFHLFAGILPGGYIGVDIFFVISGFLITSHLLREVARTGRIALPSFWARRARRLLPASLLVIVVSLIGTILIAPQSLWPQFLQEFAASATYVQNWLLAGNSVDYLAADNSPSPVQHYWSLSAEEQFYLVWPLLILLGIAITRLTKRISRRAAIFGVLAVITAASFAYCVYLTWDDPAQAYFVTPVRAWEFGLGGLLSFAPRLLAVDGKDVWWRTPLAWLGYLGLLASLLLITSSTPFPGWVALAPTLSTAAVIYAGAPLARWAPTRLAGLRPVQWFGDISYSLYLWHWPPLILLPFLFNVQALSRTQRIILLVVVIGLAALTKVAVEDPVRKSRWLTTRRPRMTLGLTAGAMVVVVGASFGVIGLQYSTIDSSIREAQQLVASGAPCLGAAAVDPAHQPCDNPALNGIIVPDRAAGLKDGVVPPGMNCRANVSSTQVVSCEITSGSKKSIALVGDSHAEHWIPAITQIAKARGWRFDTYLKGGCPFSATARADNASTAKGSCAVWNKSVLAILAKKHFDIVVTSQVSGTTFVTKPGETSKAAAIRGLVTQWKAVEKDGSVVAAIRDDPHMPFNDSSCLSALGGKLVQLEAKCEAPASALLDDPQIDAAKQSGVGLIDLSAFFCQNGVCPGVIGHVVVYRDTSHMGGTYSRTLSPYFAKQLDAIVARAR